MGDHRALTAKQSGAILRTEVRRFAVEIVLLRTLWVKRDAGKGTPAKALYAQKGFEVVDFVATTRRWHDRGNPRDAGECYAWQSPKPDEGASETERPCQNKRSGYETYKQDDADDRAVPVRRI